MTDIRFNRIHMEHGAVLPEFSEKDIRTEPTYWREDYEHALKGCGDVMRLVLQKVPLKWDRNRVFVTVKVQHLQEGMYPADTSGMLWHVDCPISIKGPVMRALGVDQAIDIFGRDSFRVPRVHMFTTSRYCATEFLEARDVVLRMGKCIRDFRDVNEQVKAFLATNNGARTCLPTNQIVTTDCWELHRGVMSTKTHWRLWVRIAEMDSETLAPPRNPNAVYRRSDTGNGGLL